ncbi:BTAD domain-containing putative transcriptional regulator [Kitasatospora sp. NPDC057015]|uniref:AfsR/SARP family transcriptional regulator n=1 Tax=Kitasatospora sp. NPDC057015 TaxID=3346001 RepID=UPI00363DD1A2
MRVDVLGTLGFRFAGQVFALRGPKLRKVLALLALHANEDVNIDVLAHELWGENQPATAVMTVRTHIYHLRRWFSALPATAECKPHIVSQPYGYRLEIPEESVDARVFRLLFARGQDLLDAGQLDAAADLFGRALALWRGPVLADVRHGAVIEQLAAELGGLRDRAIEHRLATDLERGRHRDVVDELRVLVAAQPFNEWRHAQLIRALHGAGRRAEALGAYQSLRTLLNRELGVEPSGDVQRLRGEILRGVA